MKQIIALGGGGFSMEPENPLLDLYILEQAGKKSPSICFIPTASGDSDSYISRFYKAFEAYDCQSSHLSLFKPPSQDLESFVLEKDIIFVGGGNTKNLLALWREWELDRILYKAWDKGIVMSGISAGAICWFESGVTDSFGTLRELSSLGFLGGSCCPHYDGEAERRGTYTSLVKNRNLKDGYAIDDGAALHFIGNELHTIVSSRKHAGAYYVSLKDGEAVEDPLPAKYLGSTYLPE
ncbi:Type 1 glutamine amidotransferase-like domain-containing protein [Peribacillus sp. SCS-26]|uniref:Type 1 glutamine amidotransferase-like domain-containing protein n=1 Tax=Paraperibacillus marinus TaxID=3115295 RepID=UPI003906791D